MTGLALKYILEKHRYRDCKVRDWMGLIRERAENETKGTEDLLSGTLICKD